MKIVSALVGIALLTGCTAQQGKQFITNLGSGVGIVETDDKLYTVKLRSDDQTRIDKVQRLNTPFTTGALAKFAISPDIPAGNALTAISSPQGGVATPTTIYIGIYDPRNGVRRYSRSNQSIKKDVFGATPPADNAFSYFAAERACWHNDDEFVLGIGHLLNASGSQDQRLYVKYTIENRNIAFVSKQYVGGSLFPNTRPQGYTCKDHPLHDKGRFDVINKTLHVDSTPENQPVSLEPVQGVPTGVVDADVVLFK